MSARISRALEAGFRIRPTEQRRVALMAAYAANAIGAVVVGRSVRDALYLTHAQGSAGRGLAGLYVVSSAAIVLVSFLYARVADRAPRGTLNALGALASAGLGAGFWALLSLGAGPWVYPALYVFVEAMGALVVIQFWTLANDVFHAREAKRLFGIIGGGGTLANVVFGLVVGHTANTLGAANLLLLMVAQLSACALLARAGARHAHPAPPPARRGPRTQMLSGARVSLLGNPHLTVVALIGAVSAAAVTIVDFQFKLAAASVLHQNDLAGYFGRFYGVCGGIALAVQIWVTGRVLERYGILASLLPLPCGLALGSASAAALPNPGLFVSSLAKGSDTVFRYTINDASVQLLYLPVPPQIRGRAKAFIDGILKPTAIAATGALLFFYKAQGGSARPLTLAVLLLAAGWVLLIIRARSEYVKSLVQSLERRHLDLSGPGLSAMNEATLKALRTALQGDPATVLHALSLVSAHVKGADLAADVLGLLRHEDPRVRAAAAVLLGERRATDALEALRALLEDPQPAVRAAAVGAVCAVLHDESIPLVQPLLDLAREGAAEVRAAAAVALIRHAGLDGMLVAAEPLKALLAARDPRDRAAAADALGNIGVRNFYRPLLGFLHDVDPAVRRRAIAAAGKLHTPELVPALIAQLRPRETALEAAGALASFGHGIEPQLRAVLLDPAAHEDERRGVALVLQRLATQPACDALVEGLSADVAPVRKAAARGLVRLQRRNRALRPEPTALAQAIRAELAAARNALSALKRLQLPQPAPGQAPHSAAGLLALALLEERDARVLESLALLEVLLPQLHLDVVAENLRAGNAAARSNAIEVLDNSLPEPWKRMVLAALDELKRRGAAIPADGRELPALAGALIRGESGTWVGACTVGWALEAGLPLAPLVPALETALLASAPALREAAALALARAEPALTDARLRPLLTDAALSVRRAAAFLLKPSPPRATA